MAALVAAFSWPTSAQMVCTERAALVAHLCRAYAETTIGRGIAGNGGVVELLSSPDGESWTLIITMPNGLSCLLASGENWSGPLPVRCEEEPA